jgi:hypothetical protein
MPASESEVLVGRRYLERGFLDAAMKLFLRNAEYVVPSDWVALADRLMERNRVPDVVRVCELGGVPLPRERLLALGDGHLRRKDLDATVRLYELAAADHERWARLVDVLSGIPERERMAIRLAERHLRAAPEPQPMPQPRRMKAVK